MNIGLTTFLDISTKPCMFNIPLFWKIWERTLYFFHLSRTHYWRWNRRYFLPSREHQVPPVNASTRSDLEIRPSGVCL